MQALFSSQRYKIPVLGASAAARVLGSILMAVFLSCSRAASRSCTLWIEEHVHYGHGTAIWHKNDVKYEKSVFRFIFCWHASESDAIGKPLWHNRSTLSDHSLTSSRPDTSVCNLEPIVLACAEHLVWTLVHSQNTFDRRSWVRKSMPLEQVRRWTFFWNTALPVGWRKFPSLLLKKF